MSRWRIGLLLLLGIPALSSAAAEGPMGLAGLEGAWVRTRLDRDDEAREAEIARVTESMSFLTRGFARSLMSRRMRPHASLQIACDEAGRLVRSEADGGARKGQRGEDQFRHHRDGSVEQVWSRGPDGHGTTIWELSPDGQQLSIRISAYNPRLEESIRYTTTYRRADGAGETEHRTCPAPR